MLADVHAAWLDAFYVAGTLGVAVMGLVLVLVAKATGEPTAPSSPTEADRELESVAA